MSAKVFSCSFTGLNCHIIEVQSHVSGGLSSFSIVGLGDTSVQESKERVRSSIKNCGLTFPPSKKTVNLAPAQIRKQGSLFDLPIAVSLLLESNQLSDERIKNSVIIGELSLNGRLNRVDGVLPITHHAREQGFKRIFLPRQNAGEASFIEGIEIFPLEDLAELVLFCRYKIDIPKQQPFKFFERKHQNFRKDTPALDRIMGHETAKRGLTIAAAGHHNLLFKGSPGCGKTILARALQDLLTPMSKDEILQTTKIFSIAGLLDRQTPIIKWRPFREVHHTASTVSIIGGGGNHPKPGEISLAHNGVLFFDEIAEFPRQVLDSMRQPLEDKFIQISRSNFSVKFPSNFILIGTMNPCPCGYKGDKKIDCLCSDIQVKNYQKRLSGPVLDRFDLFVQVQKTDFSDIFNSEKFVASDKEDILKSIYFADRVQSERFKEFGPFINKNSDMGLQEIQQFCILDRESKNLLKQASQNLNLSNRGHLRTLKIARTIADLDQSIRIKLTHLAEAVRYRYM